MKVQEKKVYQFVVVLLLSVGLLIMTVFSIADHTRMSDINEQMSDTMEQQREDHADTLTEWEQDYEKLLNKYGAVCAENDQLKNRVGEVDIPVYDFTPAEVYLIAQCVEIEAGYTEHHELRQRFITQVILNRLHSSDFPDTVMGVIHQEVNGVPQFSITGEDVHSRVVEPETLANVYYAIMHGTTIPENVCYFYTEGVENNWTKSLNTYKIHDSVVYAYEKED